MLTIITICAVVSTIALVLIAINVEMMLTGISKQIQSLDIFTQKNSAILQDIENIIINKK